MLYLVGIGLNDRGISLDGLDVIRKCKKVYLDSYTVEFPYSVKDLEKVVGCEITELNRHEIESSKLVGEAKKEDVCLLVYGSPLFATTHISLLEDCRKSKVKLKLVYSASVFDAVAESGLQLYKFGKVLSMPAWTKSYKPDSFLDIIIDNMKINAHSLILVDIGLGFSDALNQLVISCKDRDVKLEKILVCSRLGNDSGMICYGSVGDLGKKTEKINSPFCIIIPGKMHFMEKEVVKGFGS